MRGKPEEKKELLKDTFSSLIVKMTKKKSLTSPPTVQEKWKAS